MMVQCCRCNKTGLCRGCACVKAGRKCINGPSSMVPPQPPPPPPTPAVTARKCRHADTDLTALATNSPFPSTCSVPSIPMVSNCALTNAPGTPIVQLGASNSCPPSLEKNSRVSSVATSPSTSMPDIPAYHAAADITFSWGDLDPASFCQSLKEAYAEVVHWNHAHQLSRFPWETLASHLWLNLAGSTMPLPLGLLLSRLPWWLLLCFQSWFSSHPTADLEWRSILHVWKDASSPGELVILLHSSKKEGPFNNDFLSPSICKMMSILPDHLPTSSLKGRHMLP